MSKEAKGGKRRRWLRWTGYLALAGLGLIALGLATSLWSQARGKRLLAAEVARIKAAGIELDWRKLHPPTQADDTAKLVVKARDRFGPTNLRRGFPSPGKMIGPGVFLPASERPDWQYMDMFQGRMTTNLARWASFEAAISPHLVDLDAVSDALAIAPPVFQVDFGFYPETGPRHTGAALELTRWLSADGLHHLRVGRDEQAHRSMLALLHLSAGIAGTKSSFSVVVASTVQNQSWGLLLECVGKATWNPEQWRQVQDGFNLLDWTAAGRAALEMETAAGWHLFERIQADLSVADDLIEGTTAEWWDDARDWVVEGLESVASAPAAWFDHRLEQGEEWWSKRVVPNYWRNHWLPEDAIAFLQRSELALRDLRQHSDDAALTSFVRTNDWGNWMAIYDDAAEARPNVFRISQYFWGASLADRSYLHVFLAAQHRARLAATVCAIQRHVLAKGAPPSDLAALAPDFMSAVPIDPGDGQPLRYRLNTDGTLQLYSTGLDGIDSGGDGQPARSRSFYTATAKDILWPRPATPEEVAAYEQSRSGHPSAGDGE